MNNSYTTPEMPWDASIEQEGDGHILLPEGDYLARITRVDKQRHPGSAKIPPCNKAVLTFLVDAPEGPVNVYSSFLLHKRMEWKLSQLFRGIGAKKPGERMVMDWAKVENARCRIHIRPRKYEKDGETREVNDVEKIYDYNEADFPADPDWLSEALSFEGELDGALDEVF